MPSSGLLPVPADVFAPAPQHPLGLPVQAAAGLHEVGHRIDHLAVHIELPLLHRQVADPDRPRLAVSRQVIQRALIRRLVAVDIVEHPQLGPGQAGRVQQPVDEGVGLVHVTQTGERANRERGVAQPAEAVVPVERAADPLGQRCGRRRHHRTRGSEHHELEGEHAPNYRLPAGAIVARGGDPALPPVHGARQRRARPLAQRRQHRRPLGGKGERRVGDGPRGEAGPSTGCAAGVELEREVGPEVQQTCACVSPKSQLSGLPHPRGPQSVDGARLEGPLDLHLPLFALDQPKNLPLRNQQMFFSLSEHTGIRSVSTSVPASVMNRVWSTLVSSM